MATMTFKSIEHQISNFAKLVRTNSEREVARTHNSSYPKVAVQWLNQALYFYQSFCLVDSEVLRNRHLRVASAVMRHSKISENRKEMLENLYIYN